jgi:plasmid stabilization system protein ParE
MTLRWHGEARAEADAATAFYYKEQPRLAQRFLDELEDALRRIQRHPNAYR